MENVIQNYRNQTWKNKELIIILNQNNMDIKKWKRKIENVPNVFVYQLEEEKTLGECLNFAIKKARHDFIAKFDDDDYYSGNYIKDSIAVFDRLNVDVVGKRTIYMYFNHEKILALHKPGKENRYVTQGLKGATLVFKKEISEKILFPKLNLGEDTIFIRECVRNGFKLYSMDRNNYVCLRLGKDGHHTWNIDNNILLKKSSIICKTIDYKSFIQA